MSTPTSGYLEKVLIFLVVTNDGLFFSHLPFYAYAGQDNVKWHTK